VIVELCRRESCWNPAPERPKAGDPQCPPVLSPTGIRIEPTNEDLKKMYEPPALEEKVCNYCHGTGLSDTSGISCPKCRGSGKEAGITCLPRNPAAPAKPRMMQGPAGAHEGHPHFGVHEWRPRCDKTGNMGLCVPVAPPAIQNVVIGYDRDSPDGMPELPKLETQEQLVRLAGLDVGISDWMRGCARDWLPLYAYARELRAFAQAKCKEVERANMAYSNSYLRVVRMQEKLDDALAALSEKDAQRLSTNKAFDDLETHLRRMLHEARTERDAALKALAECERQYQNKVAEVGREIDKTNAALKGIAEKDAQIMTLTEWGKGLRDEIARLKEERADIDRLHGVRP